MAVISRLSPDLVNKIAAGEVVERPAAVVKELVENAIDASATRITVETIAGGLRRISVSDDGCGMSAEDAHLAVERYATSKVRQLSDLERIATLGFRGEALPSIAAVSKFSLTTMRPTDEVATILEIEGGEIISRIGAAPPGTTVVVADLFYNTPARLKFMRSERAERLAIATLIERLALTAPQIAFTLIQDDKLQLATNGSGKLEDVLLSIFGRQMARAWLPLSFSDGINELSGYVAKPEFARGNRSLAYWIINGRVVSPRSLQHALEEAFRQLLPGKRYPVAVLQLTIPPEQLDVNVHPTKSEVRLQNESQIYQLVLRGVRQALDRGASLTAAPSLAVEKPTSAAPYTAYSVSEQTALPLQHQQAPEAAARPISYPAPLPSESPYTVTADAAPPSAIAATESESIFPPFRVVSQLAGTYILAQCAYGWLIVDQHAAHERILYAQLVAALAEGEVASQTLLHPYSLQLTAAEEEIVISEEAVLRQLGFVIEPFGPKTALLRSLPHLLGEASGEAALREILDVAASGAKPSALNLVERALISLSCKGAIKANTWLPPARMEELLTALGQTPGAATCPHGRPTHRLIALTELDKWFLRS